MSELVVIAYPDERRAAEALAAARRLQDEGALDLDEAAAVVKDGAGRISVEGATRGSASGTAAGAAGGLLLGALIAAVFLAPALGAAFGAATGALSGSFADVERIDAFSTEVADNMPLGSSALLTLATATDPEKVLAELRPLGGTVLRTTLPDDAADRLRAALGQPAAGAA